MFYRKLSFISVALFFSTSPFQAGKMPADVGRAATAQRKARVEARPWAAPGSCQGAGQGSVTACCVVRLAGAVDRDLAAWARDPAKSDFLAGDLLPDNFNVELWLATSQPATVKPVLCSKLGVTVWLENVLSSFCPKEQWETCRVLLVQKFSLILSVIPEGTPSSVLVGLALAQDAVGFAWRKEENYFSQSSSSSVSAKAGAGYGILSELSLMPQCLIVG